MRERRKKEARRPMGTGDLHSWIAGCIKREDVTWLKAFSEAKLEADMDGQVRFIFFPPTFSVNLFVLNTFWEFQES